MSYSWHTVADRREAAAFISDPDLQNCALFSCSLFATPSVFFAQFCILRGLFAMSRARKGFGRLRSPAREAGLPIKSMILTSDGTLSLVVGEPDGGEQANPLDRFLDDPDEDRIA